MLQAVCNAALNCPSAEGPEQQADPNPQHTGGDVDAPPPSPSNPAHQQEPEPAPPCTAAPAPISLSRAGTCHLLAALLDCLQLPAQAGSGLPGLDWGSSNSSGPAGIPACRKGTVEGPMHFSCAAGGSFQRGQCPSGSGHAFGAGLRVGLGCATAPLPQPGAAHAGGGLPGLAACLASPHAQLLASSSGSTGPSSAVPTTAKCSLGVDAGGSGLAALPAAVLQGVNLPGSCLASTWDVPRRVLRLLALLSAARAHRLLAAMSCELPWAGSGLGVGGLGHRLLLLAATALGQEGRGAALQEGGAEEAWRWCQGVRAGLEALLLLKELLTGEDGLREFCFWMPRGLLGTNCNTSISKSREVELGPNVCTQEEREGGAEQRCCATLLGLTCFQKRESRGIVQGGHVSVALTQLQQKLL